MRCSGLREATCGARRGMREGYPDGPHRVVVTVTRNDGTSVNDAITVLTNETGAYEAPDRLERDSDNTVDAKPERGLLGTRLGPNANGRKW